MFFIIVFVSHVNQVLITLLLWCEMPLVFLRHLLRCNSATVTDELLPRLIVKTYYQLTISYISLVIRVVAHVPWQRHSQYLIQPHFGYNAAPTLQWLKHRQVLIISSLLSDKLQVTNTVQMATRSHIRSQSTGWDIRSLFHL